MAWFVRVTPVEAQEAAIDGGSAIVEIVAVAGVDTDADGLTDTVEQALGTDPGAPDTDGDLLPDGYEIWQALDPLNISDASADVDGDGLSAMEEYEAGSMPFEVDSDGDQFWDGIEVALATDPVAADSFPTSTAREDVNCDGFVDAIDIQTVVNAVLGAAVPVPADVNDTVGVDATDVQAAVNALLGL